MILSLRLSLLPISQNCEWKKWLRSVNNHKAINNSIPFYNLISGPILLLAIENTWMTKLVGAL